MSQPWQQITWGGKEPWRGLLRRRLRYEENPRYATEAQNVDLFGGALSKRIGTSLLTGLTGFCLTTTSSSVLQVASGSTTGINDGVDTIRVWEFADRNNPGISETRTVSSHTGTSITLSSALGFTPAIGAAWLITHPLNGGARVNGLFQATFRDGTQVLLGQAALALFDVAVNATALTEHYPTTTVDVTWTLTTTGTLTSVQGLEIGDWIRLSDAGVGGTLLMTRITNLNPGPRIITISPPADSSHKPNSGTTAVTFLPLRQATDTHFAQYANITHVAQVQPNSAIPLTAAPVVPTKYIRSLPAGVGIYRHGIKPPVTSVGVGAASPVGPSITGTYTYRLKFRCSQTGQESEPSPVSSSVSPSAQQVNVTSIAISVDPQVDKKRLYRTTDGGAGVWFFLTELANATTTYTDTTADVALSSTQMREFLDNPISDTVSVIAPWTQANRLLGIDGTTRRTDPATGLELSVGGFLRFSDQPDSATGFLKGESWPVDNTIFVGYDDGDALVGFMSFYDQVLVFKERSIWRVTGIPPNLTIEPVVFRNDRTGIGALNQKSVVMGENEVYLSAQDGVYMIDRYMGVASGLQGHLVSREIEDVYANLDRTRKASSHGVYLRQRRRLMVWIPQVTSTASEELDTALAYQVDGTVPGDPLGWVPQQYVKQSAGLEIPLQASASAVATTTGPDVVYIGDVDGNVTQLDANESSQAGDWGIFEVEAFWRSIPTGFAGAGVPVRVRGVSVMSVGIRNTTGEPDASVILSAIGAFSGSPDVQWKLFKDLETVGPTQVEQGVEKRYIGLTRGSTIALDLTHNGALMGYRVRQVGLWYQALPAAAMPVAALQVDAVDYT